VYAFASVYTYTHQKHPYVHKFNCLHI